MALTKGQKFGNYEIISQIGVGGMGAVYLAEHPLLKKKVALKIIHGELAREKSIVARFFNEARALSAIGNQHIVEVLDFGQGEFGEHFFIMEYLEGHTVAKDMGKNGPVEAHRAAHIGAQIANGLAAAHDQGLLHRDLKPDNVMLVRHLADPDFVKILDFGLAKAFLDQEDQAGITAAGVLMGTPQYMSPEACQSLPKIDQRADIYSLGVLLFQMVTGRLPFESDSTGALLVMHVKELPPAPSSYNTLVPKELDEIILKCLEKSRKKRYQTMHEVEVALSTFSKHAPIATHVPGIPFTGADGATMIEGSPVAGSEENTAYISPAANTFGAPPPMPGEFRQKTPAIDTSEVTGAFSRSEMMTSNPWHIVLALMLVIGVVGLLWALVGGDSSEQVVVDAQEVDAVEIDAPVDAPIDAPVPIDSPPPIQEVEILIDTEPGGATVIDKETKEVLGKSKLALRIKEGETRTLILKRRGRHTKEVSVSAEQPQYFFQLSRKRSGPSKPKNNGGGILDP